MRISDFVRLEEVFDNHDFLVDGGVFGFLERIVALRREDCPGIYTRNNTYQSEGVSLDKILVCHNNKLHKLSDVIERLKRIEERLPSKEVTKDG